MIDAKVLKLFCHPDREVTRAPFSRGDYTYATNGFCAVRVPRMAEITNEVESRIESLDWDFDSVTKWLTPPSVDEASFVECGYCEGNGFMVDCDECDGEGEVELQSDYNDYSFKCKGCDGEGVIAGSNALAFEDKHNCTRCGGSGKKSNGPIQFGDQYLHPENLAIINKLPNVQMQSQVGVVYNGSVIKFKFDGGVGIVMPVRM